MIELKWRYALKIWSNWKYASQKRVSVKWTQPESKKNLATVVKRTSDLSWLLWQLWCWLLPHDIAVKLCCTPLCDKDRFVLPQDKHGQFTFVRGNRQKPNLNALKLHTQSPGSLVLTRIPLTGILVTYFPSGIKFYPTEMMTSCRDLIIPLGSGFDFL